VARAALSTDAVVDLALHLVDDEGPAALTLAAVASCAGVATPSLYKHIRSLAELRALLSVRIADQLTERIRAHRYATVSQAAEPPAAQAAVRLVDVMLAALRAYGLEHSDAIHAARCLRAAVHGFAVLEVENGFQLPEKVDDSYELLIQTIVAGLRTPPPRPLTPVR